MNPYKAVALSTVLLCLVATIVQADTIQPYVLGTSQLSGTDAVFGKTYTLGKKSPFNFKLNKAEYTVLPQIVGTKDYVLAAKNKYILLHMTYQNPNKTNSFVRWDTFRFSAVDINDQSYDGLMDLVNETNKTSVEMSFLPGQKLNVCGIMQVPAAGQIVKLVISSKDTPPLVLRYDLRGHVAALSAPYADPADSTGATALTKVPAQSGVPYTLGYLSCTLDSVSTSDAKKIPLEGSNSPYITINDKNYAVFVSFHVTNVAPISCHYRWDTLRNNIFDSDGINDGGASYLLLQSSNREVGLNLDPGQTLAVRYLYVLPKGAAPAKVDMSGINDRTFEFTLPAATQ